jgi:hypothetical protein
MHTGYLLPCKDHLKLPLLHKIAHSDCLSVLRHPATPLVVLCSADQVLIFSLLHLVSPKLVKHERALIWERSLQRLVGELSINNYYQSQWANNSDAGRTHSHLLKHLYFSEQNLKHTQHSVDKGLVEFGTVSPQTQLQPGQITQHSQIKQFKLLEFHFASTTCEFIILLQNGQAFIYNSKTKHTLYINDLLFTFEEL